jgi:hypothetical protein
MPSWHFAGTSDSVIFTYGLMIINVSRGAQIPDNRPLNFEQLRIVFIGRLLCIELAVTQRASRIRRRPLDFWENCKHVADPSGREVRLGSPAARLL